MAIRLFDDAYSLETTPEVVDCPDCQGAGEIARPGSEQREAYGQWSCEHDTCISCQGTGFALADDAVQVTCCVTGYGRPATKWRGDRCVHHDDVCDEHRPVHCGPCREVALELGVPA